MYNIDFIQFRREFVRADKLTPECYIVFLRQITLEFFEYFNIIF